MWEADEKRVEKLREIVATALEMLESADDPAPSDVDLTEIAVLLDQALDILCEAADACTAATEKTIAAVDDLSVHLEAVEARTVVIFEPKDDGS